jgi:hypothetical protein
MAVEDRVAFALTFLSDLRLAEYILSLTTKLTEEGDLAGLLLTGMHYLCAHYYKLNQIKYQALVRMGWIFFKGTWTYPGIFKACAFLL